MMFALNLGSAGEDRERHGIAKRRLDARVDRVSGSAVDLNGSEADVDGALADRELGESNGERGVRARVHQPTRSIEEKLRSVVAKLHVSDPVRDGLVLSDRTPALRARARVGRHFGDLAVHQPREILQKTVRSQCIESWKMDAPWPSVPRRFAAGTRQEVEIDGG
jgi:hypothetical protein